MSPRKSKRAAVEQVDLEGPTEFTLTPPPQRRLGLAITLILVTLVGLGALGLALAQPAFFVTAVQAFSLGWRP